MALIDFLLARIAADEAVAREASEATEHANWRLNPTDKGWEIEPTGAVLADESQALHVMEWTPARVLQECQAKRDAIAQIVALRIESGRIARAMATVWSWHPDYDPDWQL